jgi:hypothetical protein
MKNAHIFFAILFSFTSLIGYTQSLSDYHRFIEENGEINDLPYDIDVNKIDSYTKYLMAIGEVKNISELGEKDRSKYDIVLNFISDNDDENRYYYTVNITLEIDEENIQMSLSEYTKYFYRYENKKIIEIGYNIFYEDYFYILYDAMQARDGYADFIFGDPTGKCFTVAFNERGEFINRYRWK